MPLTGPEKAVLMLLSLDESAAAPIVAELDDAELRKLSEVATMMRTVPAASLDDVYHEFISRTATAVAVPRGGLTYLRRLATRALGESRTQEIFQAEKQSGLDRIATTDPRMVVSVVETEHPQVIAAILSQLEAEPAARIFEALPEDRQASVIQRLATMTIVPAGLLDGVAAAIADELPPPEVEASISVDGAASSAGILRKLGKETSTNLLARLDEDATEIAEQIRRSLYTFEDLAALDTKSLRALLKDVPQDRLVLALKTASDNMKSKIFGGMSSRAADLLRDDLEALGGVRLADVDAAQREIVGIALRLEAEGQISLGGGEELV